MSWLSRLANAFRGGRVDRELDDELRFHLESRAADLARSGVPPPEAARRARLEFGALEGYKERCREARGLRLDKRNVHLPEPIKNVGTYMVVVEVADGATATLKIMVVAKS